jgi:predicted secreted acid phosphatase
VNVLDEVPQSYSHQGNPELDQTMYIPETWDHEFVDSKVAKLLSKFCAFCEEEGHAIMDYPFVPFHIRAGITRHVE